MGTDMDFNSVSTDVLAETLRERMIKEGVVVWPSEVYKLVAAISVIPCVDAFPVRVQEKQIPEIGFIRRNTGLYKGKWWCIGGRVNLGESFGCSLKRHVHETLGVNFSLAPGLSWNRPVWTAQHSPTHISLQEGEYAGHEPSKYCTSNTYLVRLESERFIFGSTAHGGQEAKELRWFPADKLPPVEEIAYGGEETVRACAEWALENLYK